MFKKKMCGMVHDQYFRVPMRALWLAALGALAVLGGLRQLEQRKLVMLGMSMGSFQRQELGQERHLRDRESVSRAGSMSMGTGLLLAAPPPPLWIPIASLPASLCAHGTVSRVCLAGMCRRSPGPARPRAGWPNVAESHFRLAN